MNWRSQWHLPWRDSLIESIHADEFVMQQIGIFVQTQFVSNLSIFIELIVFGNFMLVVHEDFHTESLFSVAIIFL